MSGGEGDARYYAVSDVLRFAAGSAESVVIDPISGRVHVLSAEQERVLAACRGERTLDEHAAEASQRLGREPEALRGLLLSLVLEGLFVEEGALRALVRDAAQPPREPARLTTLGVPTHQRSQALAACLRGHAAAAREHGRRVTCVVADSSVDDDTRAELEALGAGGVAVRHAARAQRARFAALLAARAGVDPALVRLALFGDARIGIDTGANRNTLLLDSAGEPLLMTDDDARPRAARAPDAPREASAPADPDPDPDPFLGRALCLASADPFEAWFADPGTPVVADDRWESPDPFALHEALLGADVARVATAAAAGAGIENRAGGPFFKRLARHGGRVRTTQLGCAGDHGMGASFSLLLFVGASRERLLASEARFLDAFTRRRILRSTRAATIADTAFCMSLSLGVDTRELVAPFAPAGRNSDGLFGVMMRACASDAFTAFLPWAVEHVPPSPRTTSFEREHGIAGRGEMNDFVRLAVTALFEPRGAGTAAHLEGAGRALSRLAGRPREAEHFFREQAMRGMGRRLLQMERALAEHGRRPAYWARGLEGFASAVRAALARPAMYLPHELTKAHDEESARALFFRYLGDLGRLVSAWPALFEAARELRANGERLSEPLGPAAA